MWKENCQCVHVFTCQLLSKYFPQRLNQLQRIIRYPKTNTYFKYKGLFFFSPLLLFGLSLSGIFLNFDLYFLFLCLFLCSVFIYFGLVVPAICTAFAAETLKTYALVHRVGQSLHCFKVGHTCCQLPNLVGLKSFCIMSLFLSTLLIFYYACKVSVCKKFSSQWLLNTSVCDVCIGNVFQFK